MAISEQLAVVSGTGLGRRGAGYILSGQATGVENTSLPDSARFDICSILRQTKISRAHFNCVFYTKEGTRKPGVSLESFLHCVQAHLYNEIQVFGRPADAVRDEIGDECLASNGTFQTPEAIAERLKKKNGGRQETSRVERRGRRG